jgi:hypothetical protein
MSKILSSFSQKDILYYSKAYSIFRKLLLLQLNIIKRFKFKEDSRRHKGRHETDCVMMMTITLMMKMILKKKVSCMGNIELFDRVVWHSKL